MAEQCWESNNKQPWSTV